jgi:hypothetical protein
LASSYPLARIGIEIVPRLPPCHADPDLAVAGKAFFEVTCDKPRRSANRF